MAELTDGGVPARATRKEWIGLGVLTLAALVRRPGRVHHSRTHIESCFDLSQLDLRVRRAALDVDPGWVPWLGRVVRFHYGEHDDGGR